MRKIAIFFILAVAIVALSVVVAAPRALAAQSAIEPTGPLVRLELVADGFTHPIALQEAPDGSGRRFIADQTGQIWILTADGTLLPDPFLDVSDRMVALDPGYDERGLLGLAFHPDYANNGRFFVYYSAPLRDEAPDDWDHTSHLSEFAVSPTNPDQADPDSEQILLHIDQPQSNHNGGTLEFGPQDGYLYVSLGDGGGAGDIDPGHVPDWYDVNEGGNGQDIEQNLLGSILRIDVDSASPWAVPADNPFVTLPLSDTLKLQWAYGFRNPYRFSFDMAGNNAMYVGDAGQEVLEEVSIVQAGGNYGWNVKEGTSCFNAADFASPLPDCPDTVGAGHPLEGDPLLDPIIEFFHYSRPGGLGAVVVGGHVYRGDDVPSLSGRYIFGIWAEEEAGAPEHIFGAIYVAKPSVPVQGVPQLWRIRKVRIQSMEDMELQHYLLSFGQDLEGEVYVLTTDAVGPSGDTGKVYKFVQPGQRASHLNSAPSSNAPLNVIGSW